MLMIIYRDFFSLIIVFLFRYVLVFKDIWNLFFFRFLFSGGDLLRVLVYLNSGCDFVIDNFNGNIVC